MNQEWIRIPDEDLPGYRAYQARQYPRIHGLQVTALVLVAFALLYAILGMAALSRSSMDAAGGSAMAAGIFATAAATFWIFGHLALKDKRRRSGFERSGWPSIPWRTWLTVVAIVVVCLAGMALFMLNFPVGSQAAP